MFHAKSMAALNSIKARMQPCRTPSAVVNLGLSVLPTCTLREVLVYSSVINFCRKSGDAFALQCKP